MSRVSARGFGLRFSVQPSPFHLPRWCQDFFTVSEHTGGNGRSKTLYCSDNGANIIMDKVDLAVANTQRNFMLVTPKPGHAGTRVVGNVFQKLDYSGHLWINLFSLKDALNITCPDVLTWKWWQKKETAMVNSADKFHVGRKSFRKSQPIGRADTGNEPERCLPYPSVSTRLLLLTLARSSFTDLQTKGLVQEEQVRVGFASLFEGMMDQLPQDRTTFTLCPGASASTPHSRAEQSGVAFLGDGRLHCLSGG